MPINIPNGLPAKQILESEKIFALEEDVARKQDIRPLRIVILNLMPKKIETETQILRLISKSPLQGGYRFYDGQQSCFQKHECRSSVEVL